MSLELSRPEAWSLFCEWTESPSLRKHVLAVEAAMRAYARRFGEDEERLGVADPRHVVEHDLLGREQAGGEERQGRVLVAGGYDGARERHPAFDDELFHQRWERGGRTDVGPARKLG